MNKKEIIAVVKKKFTDFKCKHCSPSGCGEGNYHDEKLIEAVIEETLKFTKT